MKKKKRQPFEIDIGANADWLKDKPVSENLEEAVALALQNYRSGLIDADDLVAFLLPSRLEEGGPGSGHVGHAGRPGKVGGSMPGEGDKKALFQTSLKSWSENQPWAQNKEAIKKGSVAGIQYDSNLRASAQYRETYIAVGDAFFREDIDSRRLTLYHEAGHSLAGPAFGKRGKFLDVIEPFRQDKHRARSVRSTYDNFAGLSSQPEEFLADVYTDLIHGGKTRYESQKYLAVYDHVARLAKQQGLPYQQAYKIKDGKWTSVD